MSTADSFAISLYFVVRCYLIVNIQEAKFLCTDALECTHGNLRITKVICVPLNVFVYTSLDVREIEISTVSTVDA